MITMVSLLNDMLDRGRLARWPDPEYRTRQFSSYDRSSVSSDKPGWFGNKDYNEFLRKEERDGRTEWVLVDVEGPGVVTRFWNALGGVFWKDAGMLRFYFDGNPVPEIEAPVTEVVGGALLAGKPFSYQIPETTLYEEENYLARNLFLPLPYFKRCLITWEDRMGVLENNDPKRWGCFYYHI